MTTPSNDLETKYKATKLWNEIIRSFRREMPVGRHRRQLKFYDETFTGISALNWLHEFLSSKEEYADSNISKEQAHALLNKFLIQGLFSPVRPSNVNKVKSDQTLYKFSDISPSKLGRTPLAVRIHRKASMSTADVVVQASKYPPIKKIRGPVTPIRFRKLPSPMVGKVSPIKNESKPIVNNENKLTGRSPTKRKVNVSENENRGSPKLKSRDNYEHIDSMSEASSNLSQMQLVSRTLQQTEIDHIWKTAAVGKLQSWLSIGDINELLGDLNIEGCNIRWNALNLSRSGITIVHNNNDGLPSWVLRAMRCLTRWPFDHPGQFGFKHTYPGFQRDVFAQIVDFVRSNCCPLLSGEFVGLMLSVISLTGANMTSSDEFVASAPLESNSQQCLASSLQHIQNMSPRGAKLIRDARPHQIYAPLVPNEPHYETEFGQVDPITRILMPKHQTSHDLLLSSGNSGVYANLGELERAGALERSETTRSSLRRPSFSRMSRLRSSLIVGPLNQRRQPVVGARNWDRLTLEPPVYASTQPMSVALRRSLAVAGDKLHEVEAALDSLPGLVQSPELMRKVREARVHLNISKHHALTNTHSLESALPGSRYSTSSDGRAWYEDSPPQNSTHSCTSDYWSVSGPVPQSGPTAPLSNCMKALSACLLFLPAKQRHWLHFFVRFMAKIGMNKCLKLDTTGYISNTQKVRNALVPFIFGDTHDCDKLIDLLINHEDTVFTAPEILCATVRDSIHRAQRQKIELVSDGTGSLKYCARISKNEYCLQSLSASQMALTELLDTIVQDENMLSKSKKARLRQFETEYPSIFQRRFPSADSFKALFPEKPKRRNIVSNPLRMKLKALRI